jgi:[ribosomal protein S5]-alanine N-acetyltransferase
MGEDSMTLVAPPETLKLARLQLRRPKLTDADALFAIGSDPEVARFADWPLNAERGPALERLRQRAEQWESGAEYYWVITLLRDDRAIGACSTRVQLQAADVGYLLDRRHWGHGYATEAARAIVEWAFSTPPIRRVWATCDTQNVASARVLEKIGMTREGTLRRAIVRPNLSTEPRDAYIYARVR